MSAARAHPDLRLHLGLWLSGDPTWNAQELQELARLRDQFDFVQVSGVSVGNETLLRGEQTVDSLARWIDQVRALLDGTDVAVTTSDGIAHCDASLAPHVDFLFPTIHPYWDGVAAEDCVAAVLAAVSRLRGLTDVPVIVSELGWPTAGETRGAAVPSEGNAAKVLREFLDVVADEALDGFWFSAWDEGWKLAFGGVAETRWGLMDAHRRLKPALAEALGRP